MTTQIEDRIKELTAERAQISDMHTALVQQNQRLNQDFQQQVVRNQTRFAQLTGAIDELIKLRNGDAPPPDNQTNKKENTP